MNKIFLCILFFISTPLYSYNNSKDIKNDIDKIKNIDKETIIIRNPIEKESYINIEYEDNKNKPTRVIKYLENNKKINSKLYYSPIYNKGMQKFFSTQFDLNLFILIHESMHLTSKQSYIPKSNKDIFKSELAADIATVLYYHRYNNFNKQSTIKYIISIQRLRTHPSYYKESHLTYIGLEIFKSVLYKINHFNYSEIPLIVEKISNNITNFNFKNHFEFNLNTEKNIKNTYFEQLNFIKTYLQTKNNIENLFYNKENYLYKENKKKLNINFEILKKELTKNQEYLKNKNEKDLLEISEKYYDNINRKRVISYFLLNNLITLNIKQPPYFNSIDFEDSPLTK